MRSPLSFLEDIRGRVSISSVVGKRVAWDRRKSNPGKGDYWACCPFHGEKSASFHVEDRKGRYHCFGCKVSGDIFTFLVEKEGLPFPEAVERLAAEAGLPMPQLSEAEVKREETRASFYEIMEIAAKLFEAELQSARAPRRVVICSTGSCRAPFSAISCLACDFCSSQLSCRSLTQVRHSKETDNAENEILHRHTRCEIRNVPGWNQPRRFCGLLPAI